MKIKNIEAVMKSGGVERYHAMPEIPNQTLAEHQWGVAILIMKFFPNGDPQLLQAALVHDCPELLTGDTPTFAKKKQPALKSLLDQMEDEIAIDWGIDNVLTEKESQALKMCDVLEGMTYCHKHVMRGNREAEKVFHNWIDCYDSLNSMKFLDIAEYVALLKSEVEFQNA
jgi:5'-deoxynucleotidase YfbR-like HD superfamily hydrolase